MGNTIVSVVCNWNLTKHVRVSIDLIKQAILGVGSSLYYSFQQLVV